MTTNANLLESLNWRYAVKKFDANKKISSTDWETLENSLVLTPSSYGLQPWKFFIVQNPKLREQLKAASWNQFQVTDCSHYVVLTTMIKVDELHIQKYIDYIAKVRGVPANTLDGFKNAMISDVVKGPRSQISAEWNARQAYIALGNLMTSAAVLEIDTCPMEGFEPDKYDQILDLKAQGLRAIVACAVGYRSSEDTLAKAKKVRFANKDVVVHL